MNNENHKMRIDYNSNYPKHPPARTSAWLVNVSAIVSSLYMATGELYCLLTMLRTGDGGT
jgi:hypothetical protein